MFLSCCIWALSGSEQEVLARIADAGFSWIDVRADSLECGGARAAELGLRVSCVAASYGLPEGVALDSPDADAAARARVHLEKAIEYSARIGAATVYVLPGTDSSPEALQRYGRALVGVADRAAALGLKLCIEHFPGSSLPTVADTLAFLEDVGHANLHLLFDIGHAQMSGEDPAAALVAAGPRLGYVHLDDNDGGNDQHVALLDGVLSPGILRRAFTALSEIGYGGGVSLELNPELPDPLDALKRSRQIVIELPHFQS